MKPLSDIPAISGAVHDFAMDYGSFLPDAAKAALKAAITHGSPVVMIADTAELLYAYQGDITDPKAKAAAQTLAGQLALYAAQNRWHGMAEANRGPAILWAMQRELGEDAPAGTSWPTPDKDPPVDNRFAPQAPPALPAVQTEAAQ